MTSTSIQRSAMLLTVAILLGVALIPAAGTAGSGQPKVPSGDEFDGTSLDPSWSLIRPEVVDLAVAEGSLVLTLTDRALWAGPQQGVLVYKPVTGDFRATTTVRARQASDPTLPPSAPVRLGGLMARDPGTGEPGVENYVHIVVGFAPSGIAVETKSTRNSETQYEDPAWPSADAELRICRVGPTFSLYKRPIGSRAWELAATYSRPDLPPTLQVGPNIYSAVAPPNLRVAFDGVQFDPVREQQDCERDQDESGLAMVVR